MILVHQEASQIENLLKSRDASAGLVHGCITVKGLRNAGLKWDVPKLTSGTQRTLISVQARCRMQASPQKLCTSNSDTILKEQGRVCSKQHRADERAVIISVLGYVELFRNAQMWGCLQSSEPAAVMKCRAGISWTLPRCVWWCHTRSFLEELPLWTGMAENAGFLGCEFKRIKFNW